MFDTVLVANRGEIAVRVIRTLRALGIRPVAVYSDADTGARHVTEADTAIRIGPAPAAQSYLAIDRILDAAARAGAQAVHPGYGFLSENPAFARACERAGVVFVGPPPEALELMGDKIRAKRVAAAAGVPVIPGGDGDRRGDRAGDPAAHAVTPLEAARAVGYPVLLKPAAGGGGKGMRVVHTEEELAAAVDAAQREARGAFGDGTLLVERYLTRPRHIEIQVLADAYGAVLDLGERECSLQRRQQKVLEEAPSVLLDAPTRDRMGQAAVAVTKTVGYRGAGTVEFLVSAEAPERFLFLEMNTRLQVEHPVTEMITGLDLVELQLRVAAGEPLPLSQKEVRRSGHAVEARVYAEDTLRGLLPTGGRVLALREPSGPGIRVDSGLVTGDVVGTDYDPLLAKIITWGADRDTALRRLDAALRDTVILGLNTNTGLLRALVTDEDVRAGRMDTDLVERLLRGRAGDWTARPPDDVLAAAGLLALLALEPTGPVVNPFAVPGGWRIGEPAWTRWRMLVTGHDPVEVRVRGRAAAAEVAVGSAEAVPASAWRDQAPDRRDDLLVTVDGMTRRYTCAQDGAVVWLGRDGHTWAVREQEPLDAARRGQDTAGPVRAPMPGTVTVVDVVEGQRVDAGTRLLVVEAMKMEHALTAPADGVVRRLRVSPGAAVDRDAVLLILDGDPASGDGAGVAPEP